MSIHIPDIFKRCWAKKKTALIFINSDTIMCTRTIYPGATEEQNKKLMDVLQASDNPRQMILPHALDKINGVDLGYSDNPRVGNLLYPGPMQLQTNPSDRDKPLPPLKAALDALLTNNQVPKEIGIGIHERSLIGFVDSNDRKVNEWCQMLLSRIAECFKDDDNFQPVTVRPMRDGFVLEAQGLIGTGRRVHHYLEDLARHYKYSSIAALVGEKIGCVIFISSDPSDLIENERKFVHQLRFGGQRIGYCFDVDDGIQRERPYTDQMLPDWSAVIGLLETLVHFHAPLHRMPAT